MKFGKQIQSQQFTEWSAHYLDYKGLKKFINSILNAPHEHHNNGQVISEDDRSRLLQSQKAAFFFKLERELEKINSFYLQKENELKVRLRTLVDKKKILQTDTRRLKHASTLFNAIQEAFIQFEHELNKIQKYVELNNEGFRKILKKWDKRSKSTTKELYLSRQIDVQPCFNAQVLCELADIASANQIELRNIQAGIPVAQISSSSNPTIEQPIASTDVIDDMELELVKAVSSSQVSLVREILERITQHPSQSDHDLLSRVFWHACSEATKDVIDLLTATKLVDFAYVDDINERSCLHVAAMAGRLDLLQLCTQQGANIGSPDAYGRTALHYATMNGFGDCVSFLLTQRANIEARDHDGYTPLLYAVVNGHTHCVDILIKAGANIEPKHDADHIPLSLACYYGHTDIALLLYQRGAKNLPNAESLYPLHLAARQGHVELCRMLARNKDDIDIQDKYKSWTPLFWAASDGHADCVSILLEAGCQVNIKDEYGKTALHYAAWEGEMECVNLLIDAGCEVEPVFEGSRSLSTMVTQEKELAQPAETKDQDMEHELDAIPSLSLPPPIIPFRIYGHSYLDRKYQIQISLRQSPIRLYDNTQISSLKLIVSSKPDTGMIPHSVILPLVDDREVFSFQVDKLDDFLLEFDIYATFGSKVLGRGVALPETFSSADFKIMEGHRTIPLLDSHLKLVGELTYDYSVVKPFRGVQLEIGGRIETYWKSTNTIMPPSNTTSVNPGLAPDPNQLQCDGAAIGSSTSIAANFATIPSFITASSLTGDYVRVVVQLTRDNVPVVFAQWLVPFEGLDLSVSDLTYEQFLEVGRKVMLKKGDDHPDDDVCPITGNSMIVQRIASERGFLSLEDVLRNLPETMGIHLELKYPTIRELEIYSFSNTQDRNVFVDTILQSVYDYVRSLPAGSTSASIFFSSFNPAIYAVFFSTYCGLNKDDIPRGTKRYRSETSIMQVQHKPKQDIRTRSLKEAVKFAKRNNLLGVICEATPLVRVPSLIKNIKESGLILMSFGRMNADARYRSIQEQHGVDAMIVHEVVHFNTTMAGAGF
ncbi:hypothetical protein BX666DRAFT_1882142 [Dichotomocladium elegans]|nr:hypothetical protein BX666DRAFT_1882142 [Dichotomocladium elegans]